MKLNQTGTQILSERSINSATGHAIELGPNNDIYVAGNIASNPLFFPTTTSAYARAGTLACAFFMKIAPDGTNILYSTAFATRNRSSATSVGVDAAGMGYIAGSIRKRDRPDNPLVGDFPAKNSYQALFGGGLTDAYIAKFDPTKAGEESLLYTTYLGGTNDDSAISIAVDDIGQMFVVGVTASTNFPVANAFQTNYAGGESDAFVTQLNAGGTGLVFSSYLGGSNTDYGSAVAVDLGTRNVYVAGRTKSGNFLTTSAFQTSLKGADFDGFVAKIQLVEPEPTLVVNTTDDLDDGACDSVHCSLREAINFANSAGRQTIRFNIASAEIPTIRLTSTLPRITNSMVIDASTQPGANRVQLSGTLLAGGDGFYITTENVEVRGFVINGFQAAGIHLERGGKHRIVDNYIGTDPTGTIAKRNGRDGILLFESGNNEIGGKKPGEGNLISGNGQNGVYLLGEGCRSNRICGNFIGTVRNGDERLSNGSSGVFIERGSANDIGSVSGRNVISGNERHGVLIEGARAVENRLSGNYIGVAHDGIRAIGNRFHGVLVNSAFKTRIGAEFAGEGNVISGNGLSGIHLATSAASTSIHNNSIGTDALALIAVPNQEYGIEIVSSQGNAVGGTNGPATARQGNTISGNGRFGVRIVGIGGESGDNLVAGNMIGCDFLGTSGVPNRTGGIYISTPGNTVGGPTPSSRNIISGNLNFGIYIEGRNAVDNTVQGNYVGVDATGAKALPNQIGVLLARSKDCVVGGLPTLGTSPGNVISGNREEGLAVTESESIQIYQNSIGTDVSGTQALPNRVGIAIGGGFRIRVGNDRASGNVISGNRQAGIRVEPFGARRPVGTRIVGNLIGTTGAASPGALPNTGPGIEIRDAVETDILFNRIAHNPKGIVLKGDASHDNAFLENSIYSNTAAQIDLGDDGPTPNDPTDADGGPNSLQNFPEYTVGLFFSRPYLVGHVQDASFRHEELHGQLHIFHGNSCATAGENFFASRILKFESGLLRHFIMPAPPINTVVTATYTDGNGNSSEMTPCGVTLFPTGDQDLDGVSDDLEGLAPHQGDGNNDGVKDAQQPDVFSSPAPTSYHGSVGVSWKTDAAYSLTAFSVTDQIPEAPLPPSQTVFPHGLNQLTMTLTGAMPGDSATLIMYSPRESQLGHWYNYGRSPGQLGEDWHDFEYDGMTGARLESDRIILEFRDGERGDRDMQKNGVIVVFGGPAIIGGPTLRIEGFQAGIAGTFTGDVWGEAGRKYTIQGSVDMFNWNTISTVTTGTGLFQFRATETAEEYQFYRIQKPNF